MNILLCNDDGIYAEGIRSLAKHLKAAGHKTVIVAPDRERSAASHSISLRKDLQVKQIADNEYSVDGTPVDCAVIALQKIITEPIDLVISGTNAGQNMGEDVLYSGTVAAAVEASFFGYPAIAVSINSYTDQLYETASAWMVRFLELGLHRMAANRCVLNVNFPNVHMSEIKGVRLTRIGHRKYYNFIKVLRETEDGFVYRIGGDQPEWDNSKGTDAEAVADKYVSITPLGFEMTKADVYPEILEWLEDNKLL